MRARMHQTYLFTAVAVGLVVGLGGTALAQAGNSEVGTWRLNLAKSKYSQGAAPKSATIKIEAVGGGIRNIVDQLEADGTVRHYEFTANYDGKDSPVIGNSANGDTIARTRINATTVKSGSHRQHRRGRPEGRLAARALPPSAPSPCRGTAAAARPDLRDLM